MRTDPRVQDELAEMKAEIAALRAEVQQLRRQSLFGDKLQVRPDGTIRLGDIPATIEADGIHFKDTALGDGLKWDAKTGWSTLRGYSGASIAYIQLVSSMSDTATQYAAVAVQDVDVSPIAGPTVWLATFESSALTNEILMDRDAFKLKLKPLALLDGITAPDQITGYAQIYVDTADGDLKVKFGDNVVKTLATDTA